MIAPALTRAMALKKAAPALSWSRIAFYVGIAPSTLSRQRRDAAAT